MENIEAVIMLVLFATSIKKIVSDSNIWVEGMYYFSFGFTLHSFFTTEIWIAYWRGLTG